MSARVYIQQEFMEDGIRIALGRRYQDHNEIFHFDELGQIIRTLIPHDGTYSSEAPALKLPDDIAKELMNELMNFYGVKPHTDLELRADYLAERGRVDKMIQALIEGVQQ